VLEVVVVAAAVAKRAFLTAKFCIDKKLFEINKKYNL
jgi:hypothetical protein